MEDLTSAMGYLLGMTREHPLGNTPSHDWLRGVAICLRHSSRNTTHDHYSEPRMFLLTSLTPTPKISRCLKVESWLGRFWRRLQCWWRVRYTKSDSYNAARSLSIVLGLLESPGCLRSGLSKVFRLVVILNHSCSCSC